MMAIGASPASPFLSGLAIISLAIEAASDRPEPKKGAQAHG
jgi:hypothetical protein